MNTFELKLFDDEGPKCAFYTVQWQDAQNSETEKFIKKCRSKPELTRSLQELSKFIEIIIGKEHGANKAFFKFENQADALPPSGIYKVAQISIDYGHFPLRLYCLRISDTLVVLFNGGEKTAATAQGGDTSMAFREANRFAQRILTALRDKEILISENGRLFLDSNGYSDTEIIL